MSFVVQYILHRCPVCRSHVECPVRVGWRWGPIVLTAYFHHNDQGDVETIHIATMYRPDLGTTIHRTTMYRPDVWTD